MQNLSQDETSMPSHLEPHAVSTGILYITASGAQITKVYFISCLITLILAAWIVLLNAIVIYTLLYRRTNTRVSDYFVSALSVADLVTGVVMIYITTYSLIQYQNYWECLFRFGMTYTISECAYMHLFAMTVNRYIKIVRPLHYYIIFTKRRVLLISGLIWLIAIVLGLLPLMGWNQKIIDRADNATVCRFFGVLLDEYFTFHLVLNALTITITVILYGRIVYIARRHYNEIQSIKTRFQKTERPRLDKNAWKLAKTIAIVVVVSNLCWLPGVVVLVLHMDGSLDSFSMADQGDLVTYCGLTIFLNSLINPCIYASEIPIVNTRFRAIFCCTTQLHRDSNAAAAPVGQIEIKQCPMVVKRSSSKQPQEAGINETSDNAIKALPVA